MIGEAVSGLHHDLRNMLAGTMLVSERLEMNPDPDVRNAAGQVVGQSGSGNATLSINAHLCDSGPEPEAE